MRIEYEVTGEKSSRAGRKSVATDDWAKPASKMGRWVAAETQRMLRAYHEASDLITEHANQERDAAGGGYAHRQLVELVHNSADALLPTDDDFGQAKSVVGDIDGHAGHPGPPPSRVAGPGAGAYDTADSHPRGGRIAVRLTRSFLYCADNGKPIDEEGVKALMHSYMSPKRGTSQIGTFGLGFKSVLAVSDAPEFFSRSISLRFDRNRAHERIQKIVREAVDRWPTLRLPEAINPTEYQTRDSILADFMTWANNIVRLPLGSTHAHVPRAHAHNDLSSQMDDFPPEFLLFVAHVGGLELTDDSRRLTRKSTLERVGSSD